MGVGKGEGQVGWGRPQAVPGSIQYGARTAALRHRVCVCFTCDEWHSFCSFRRIKTHLSSSRIRSFGPVSRWAKVKANGAKGGGRGGGQEESHRAKHGVNTEGRPARERCYNCSLICVVSESSPVFIDLSSTSNLSEQITPRSQRLQNLPGPLTTLPLPGSATKATLNLPVHAAVPHPMSVLPRP